MNERILKHPSLNLLAIVALCAAGSACVTSQQRVSAPSLELTASLPADGLKDALAGTNARVKAGPRIRTVNFPYDSYELAPEARAVLKLNAELIRAKGKGRVIIAGHCDERGTTEYNIALGERRARTVLEYYRMLGIPTDRMRTISYGKEQPLCLDLNVDCHMINRRARTLVE
ncbi:OmpA family protein [Elusimicrobiota bacterium]